MAPSLTTYGRNRDSDRQSMDLPRLYAKVKPIQSIGKLFFCLCTKSEAKHFSTFDADQVQTCALHMRVCMFVYTQTEQTLEPGVAANLFEQANKEPHTQSEKPPERRDGEPLSRIIV